MNNKNKIILIIIRIKINNKINNIWNPTLNKIKNISKINQIKWIKIPI